MDIDAIIAEAAAPQEAALVPETLVEESKAEEQQTETVEKTEGTTEPAKDDKPADIPFPPKAVKAITKRDRQIGKYRSEAEQLRNELEQLKAGKQEAPKEAEPQEADFESYSDYMKAIARHEAKNAYKENEKASTEKQNRTRESEWQTEREEALEDNHREAKKAFTDYEDILNDNEDDLKAMAPHVKRAFLEAEHGAFALYALLKDGNLDQLNTKSPMQVAMSIARMEDKGLALSKLKTETKAPKPMTPAKGTGMGGKPLDNMSYQELKKEFKLY